MAAAKREVQLKQLQKDLQKGEAVPLRVIETKQEPEEPSDEDTWDASVKSYHTETEQTSQNTPPNAFFSN